MKKILLTSILFVFVSLSCTQGKFDGIFDLKLGMSKKQLKEVVDTTLLKDIGTDFERFDDEALIKRLNGFHLDKYKVDDNYTLENIKLFFFDDKLYAIMIGKYNAKTEELLTLKYGELSNKYDKERQTREIKWNINKKYISCSSTLASYDSDYERYSLLILDSIIRSRLVRESFKYDEKKEKEEKAQQKKEVQTLLDKL